MSEDDKKIFVVLTIILSLMVVILSSYLIYDKVVNNKEEINDTSNVLDTNEENSNNIVNNDNDELTLEKIKGVWMNCGINELSNKVCYIMNIEQEENKYVVRIGMYGTDGIITFEPTQFNKVEDNIYKLELYSEGHDSPIGSSPASTTTLTIDKSNNDIVIYNISGNKYEYVAENLSRDIEIEKYYNNYMNN